jgi:hypothetical protein
MPHVFLDSNIFFTDPFMDKNIHNRILFELAEKNLISIYISDVVKQEVLNNFEKELHKYFEEIKKNENKITKILRSTDNPPIEWKDTVKEYVTNLEVQFQEWEKYYDVEFLPFSNDFLPELVNRSIKRVKPFTDKKMEFRDGIIWLTYADHLNYCEFIEKAYFITKNTDDFTLNGEIHPDLLQDCNKFIFYKTPQDFIQNCEEIKQLQKTLKLVKWVEDEDLSNSPELVLDMIERHSFDYIFSECLDYVGDYRNSVPTNYDPDVDNLEATDISLLKVSSLKVEVILDHVIVTGHLDVNVEFDVYQNDYLHAPYREALVKIGADEVKLDIDFTLTVDQNMKVEELDVVSIEQI